MGWGIGSTYHTPGVRRLAINPRLTTTVTPNEQFASIPIRGVRFQLNPRRSLKRLSTSFQKLDRMRRCCKMRRRRTPRKKHAIRIVGILARRRVTFNWARYVELFHGAAELPCLITSAHAKAVGVRRTRLAVRDRGRFGGPHAQVGGSAVHSKIKSPVKNWSARRRITRRWVTNVVGASP